MRLLTVPPRRGVAWMRQGFAIFMRQPLAFSGLFAAFLVAVFVLMQLPVVGPLLLLAALPTVTLGFMVATREALAGRFAGPQSFLVPLRAGRDRAAALLQLGAAYAAATVGIVMLAGWLDGGALEAAMDAVSHGEAPADDAATQVAEPRVGFGIALRLGFAGLLAIPFWHAPALALWGGQGAAQALFSSTLAIWRNKGAFAAYMLAWVGVVLAFGAATSVLFGLVGQPRLAVLALMPASLLFSTAFYASLWFTFADCFGAGGGDEPPSANLEEHP